MRKISEILRLKYELHLAEREIAAACGSSRSTVQGILKRCRDAQITWPLPGELDEAALYTRLYPPTTRSTDIPLPDFAAMQAELARKGVTLMLLWQEYKATHPGGLQYSAFCERYAVFRQSRDVVLRQAYRPGEKLFVDFAGPTMPITDQATGEIKPASIFVAVLGYSNYTFACATPGQTTADWLAAQRAALEFIGGVPGAIVPDNPKAIVTRACRFEPDLGLKGVRVNIFSIVEQYEKQFTLTPYHYRTGRYAVARVTGRAVCIFRTCGRGVDRRFSAHRLADVDNLGGAYCVGDRRRSGRHTARCQTRWRIKAGAVGCRDWQRGRPLFRPHRHFHFPFYRCRHRRTHCTQ